MTGFELFVYFAGCYAIGFGALFVINWMFMSAIADGIAISGH